MISQETLEKTWVCYREIAAAENLIADLAEMKERSRDPYGQRLRDAFGNRRLLQLGVPSGENGHRLFDVDPVLAVSIIKAHLANKRAELEKMHEVIRIELDGKEG